MFVSPKGSRFKYEERPEPCRRCGAVAWWNGRRAIKNEVVRDGSGSIVMREGAVRHRARCSSRASGCGSWTVYAEDAYPHRVFQLSAVSSAVEAVALGGETRTAAAETHQASRRSVSRWVNWVGSLIDVGSLVGLCARLDSQGHRPPVSASGDETEAVSRAGTCLRLLDHLAGLLRERGALGSSREVPALAAILWHQLVRFGQVHRLGGLSPPLRVDVAFAPG